MELNYHQPIFTVGNRSNRRWVILFVILAMIIISGAIILILPSTEFRIKPVKQLAETEITIKLDLDANKVIPELGVVPAFVSGEQASTVLKNSQYINLSYQGQLISYKRADYEEVLNYHLEEAVPPEYVLIGSSRQNNLTLPEASDSGRQFSWQASLSQEIIKDMPFDLWQGKIKSLAALDAKNWLINQAGVESVEVYEKYSFLANLSKILSYNSQRYLITLDR